MVPQNTRSSRVKFAETAYSHERKDKPKNDAAIGMLTKNPDCTGNPADAAFEWNLR
jgi:hypothetical protein